MARVQLALNVTDLDSAIAFYEVLFGQRPAKVRPGYANFAIADPPLKLVLFEGSGGGDLNHLGVEVEDTHEVPLAHRGLHGDGVPEIVVSNVASFVSAYRLDGSMLWRYGAPDAVLSGPVIGDIDRDGRMEVVVGSDSTASPFFPYPALVSRDRITVEETPVKVLVPDARELNVPNKITSADFDNWVQERSVREVHRTLGPRLVAASSIPAPLHRHFVQPRTRVRHRRIEVRELAVQIERQLQRPLHQAGRESGKMSSLPLNQTPTGAGPIHRDRHLIPILVRIIGFFVVLGIVQAIHSGRDFTGRGVHAYSFLIVCLAPLAILAAVYGWAGVVDAFCWIVRRPTRGSSAREAVTFFQLVAAFAMAVGFLNTLIGLVLSLSNLADTQRLGPGIALALLSQLYGVFVAVNSIAVAAYIARRHRQIRALTPLARRATSVAGLTVVAGTLTTLLVFGILMLSVAPGL